MKFLSCRVVLAIAWVSCLTALAAAAPKGKEPEGQKVDSGSFGVFQKGHRVGTETFSIYQTTGGSVIISEFKTENGATQDLQTSEMRLATNGDLRQYEWKELSPDKAESVVAPNDEFLNQRWSGGPDDKSHEQPYLLPPSTSILDDYFFIHREVLAWKYLGGACKQEQGKSPQCPLKKRFQFGTLNPHQRSSAAMTVEFVGRETISLKAGPRELMKVELKSEAGTWQLWLDDQFKAERMVVVGEDTVVDRD